MDVLLLLVQKLIKEGYERSFFYLLSQDVSWGCTRYELFICPSDFSGDVVSYDKPELSGSIVTSVSDFVNSEVGVSTFFRVIIKDDKPCIYVFRNLDNN